MRDLGEVTVSVIVIYQHGDGLKHIRMAISAIALTMLAAPHVVPIQLHVAIDDQAEEAVVVQIYPG